MNDRDGRRWHNRGGSGGNLVWFLGMIGAMVFYIQQAHGFWGVVVAVLKALVWPAFLVYELLKFVMT
jgi:hypothetical protein